MTATGMGYMQRIKRFDLEESVLLQLREKLQDQLRRLQIEELAIRSMLRLSGGTASGQEATSSSGDGQQQQLGVEQQQDAQRFADSIMSLMTNARGGASSTETLVRGEATQENINQQPLVLSLDRSAYQNNQNCLAADGAEVEEEDDDDDMVSDDSVDGGTGEQEGDPLMSLLH